MKVGFEILSDDNTSACDRCKSKEWLRLAFVFTPTLTDEGAIAFPKGNPVEIAAARAVRVIMCIDCLAHAIQSVTGWNMRKLLNRYREISPLYGSVPVGMDVIVVPTDKIPVGVSPKPIKRKSIKKGKR